jgi:hypothetical protein
VTDQNERLTQLSSRLLDELDAVKELELEKRQVPISTPRFHRLASEIEERARRVFAITAEQQTAGDHAFTQDTSIAEFEQKRCSGPEQR